jgi:hypothetical protein
MRVLFGLALLAFLAVLTPQAKAQGMPPGPYQRDCRDLRMQGSFLSGFCRGSNGSGESTINVLSCGSEIRVDPQGGLVCDGPGVNRPPPPPPGGGYYPPGAGRPPGGGYDPRPPGGGYDPRPPAGGRWSATLYEGSRYRGRYIVVTGDEPNLDGTGMNDRVGSIRFGARSGPWLVCSKAGFKGRCATVDRDVRDTGRLGLGDSISSLRPLR